MKLGEVDHYSEERMDIFWSFYKGRYRYTKKKVKKQSWSVLPLGKENKFLCFSITKEEMDIVITNLRQFAQSFYSQPS